MSLPMAEDWKEMILILTVPCKQKNSMILAFISPQENTDCFYRETESQHAELTVGQACKLRTCIGPFVQQNSMEITEKMP